MNIKQTRKKYYPHVALFFILLVCFCFSFEVSAFMDDEIYILKDIDNFWNISGNFTEFNLSNWDSAYSWGDHALVGYLTNYTEIDPVWISDKGNYYTKTQIDNQQDAQNNTIDLKLNITDQRYNDTVLILNINTTTNTRIDNLKLGNTTQEMIDAVNTTGYLINWSDVITDTDTHVEGVGYLYNDSTYMYLNETYLNVTIDARDTDTVRGYNTTTMDLDAEGNLTIKKSWFDGIYAAISYVDGLFTNYYNKTEIDAQQLAQNNTIATKLDADDQRYNNTVLIYGINTTVVTHISNASIHYPQSDIFINASQVDNLTQTVLNDTLQSVTDRGAITDNEIIINVSNRPTSIGYGTALGGMLDFSLINGSFVTPDGLQNGIGITSLAAIIDYSGDKSPEFIMADNNMEGMLMLGMQTNESNAYLQMMRMGGMGPEQDPNATIYITPHIYAVGNITTANILAEIVNSSQYCIGTNCITSWDDMNNTDEIYWTKVGDIIQPKTITDNIYNTGNITTTGINITDEFRIGDGTPWESGEKNVVTISNNESIEFKLQHGDVTIQSSGMQFRSNGNIKGSYGYVDLTGFRDTRDSNFTPRVYVFYNEDDDSAGHSTIFRNDSKDYLVSDLGEDLVLGFGGEDNFYRIKGGSIAVFGDDSGNTSFYINAENNYDMHLGNPNLGYKSDFYHYGDLFSHGNSVFNETTINAQHIETIPVAGFNLNNPARLSINGSIISTSEMDDTYFTDIGPQISAPLGLITIGIGTTSIHSLHSDYAVGSSANFARIKNDIINIEGDFNQTILFGSTIGIFSEDYTNITEVRLQNYNFEFGQYTNITTDLYGIDIGFDDTSFPIYIGNDLKGLHIDPFCDEPTDIVVGGICRELDVEGLGHFEQLETSDINISSQIIIPTGCTGNCDTGEIGYNSTHICACTSTNTWKGAVFT